MVEALSTPPCIESEYARQTYLSRNLLRRFAQRGRLRAALHHAGRPASVLDFGCGSGEFARLLAATSPRSLIVAYEPVQRMRRQAAATLSTVNAELVASLTAEKRQFELITCLEVLEHLPPRQLAAALASIRARLAPGGRLLVTVPIETGLPGLAKALFGGRRFLLQGLRGALGLPIDRETLETRRASLAGEPAQAVTYYSSHIGFSHGPLKAALRAAGFEVISAHGAPFPMLPSWLNSQLVWVLRAHHDDVPVRAVGSHDKRPRRAA